MHAYIIFVTPLPALSLRPFELTSLCSGNPIPVNHQVINDHFFPAEYGWLHLTLQLNLTHRDRRTERQQNNKLPLLWTGTVSYQLSPLNIRDICHTRVCSNRDSVVWRCSTEVKIKVKILSALTLGFRKEINNLYRAHKTYRCWPNDLWQPVYY